MLINLLILLTCTNTCLCATVALTSDSDFVGDLTTYNAIIQSHNNPTIIQTIFSQWSPNQDDPYQSDYAFFMQDGSGQIQLSCKLKFSGTVIQCDVPSPPDTISLRITNVRNPSSTKPYSVQFNLLNSSSTQSVTAQLTVTQINTFDMIYVSYDTSVGTTSSNVQLYLDFQFYVTASTILQLQFDPTLVSIAFNPDSTAGYTLQSTSSGTVELSNWNDLSLGTHIIPNITIINPQAALTYTLTASLYYNQSATTYRIQAYSLSTTLSTVSFTTLSSPSNLQLGLTDQTIQFTSIACPYSPVDKTASNQSYVQIMFSVSQLSSSECSNATLQNSTNKVCSFDSDLTTLSITGVTMEVLSISTTSVDVHLYTYHAGASAFLPLCSSTISLNAILQSIASTTFDLSLCSSSQTGGQNPNTVLVMQVDSWQNDDIVTISGIQGTIQSPWTASSSDYTYTLSASNTLNSTHISMSLPYISPAFITTNEIAQIRIQRPSLSLTYAQYTQSVGVCTISQATQISQISLVMDSDATYSKTNYNIFFTPSFNDYQTTGSITIEFNNSDYYLFGGIAVNVNSQSKTIIVNSNNATIEVLNAFDGSSSYQLVIRNVLNPSSTCTICTLTVLLYSSSLLKEQSTITPTYTTNSITITHTPISILTIMNITVNLSNANRFTYFNDISSSLTLTYPFLCSGSASTSITWPSNTNILTISLIDCDIQYMTQQFFQIAQTISGQASTHTNSQVQLLCPDNCYACDQFVCSQCVNISHSSFIYLYSGQCYSFCPSQTYLDANTSTCFLCHISCQTCNGQAYTDCLTCLKNYQLTNGFCLSVCGAGAYLNNGQCTSCHENCDYCLNSTYCYQCKELATMIEDGVCAFTVCESPCNTCLGTNSTCTSCVSANYLYESACYTECPEGTYSDQDNLTCIFVTSPVLYFPATIISIVLISLAFIGNACINRNLTDTHRKYINVLTYSSSILAYMEIIAIIIVVALSHSDYLPVAYAGLAIWVIANIIFLIYYCKVIRNDPTIMSVVQKMSQRSKCAYYTIIVFSMALTLRTYRVLFCGIFKGVAPYLMKKKKQSSGDKIKGKVANEDLQNSGKDEKKSQHQLSSQQSDELNISKFELKKPILIYITIFSLLGSLLFLITGALEIIFFQYINMIFWGLDLIIVVIASIIVTIFDMWVGIKKSYLMAVQNPVQVNETVENLKQFEQTQQKIEQDHTQQKIIHNPKNTSSKIKSKKYPPVKSIDAGKKMNPKKSIDFKKNTSPKNNITSPKSIKSNKSKSPPPKNVSSTNANQVEKSQKLSKSPKNVNNSNKGELEKIQKLKAVSNRYSGILNSKDHKRRYTNNDDDVGQIPDIKVFDDADLYRDEDEKAQKIKRLPKDNRDKKSLKLLNLVKSTQLSNQLQQSTIKIGWKMDDIYLGFLQNDSDKQTVKIIDDLQKEQEEEPKEEMNSKESEIQNVNSDHGQSQVKIYELDDDQMEEEQRESEDNK